MLYEQDNINKFIVNSYYASVKTLNLEFFCIDEICKIDCSITLLFISPRQLLKDG